MGSSPLARGLRTNGQAARLTAGIIPARAGFTGDQLPTARHNGDHPRSRGVYGALAGLGGSALGSSPLARGLLLHLCNAAREGGIIPARAGFTRPAPWTPFRRPDHPRSRGVYGQGRPTDKRNRGSSPLARGLHKVAEPAPAAAGIIPARAGFTTVAHPGRERKTDHPRSRGVYGELGSGTQSMIGSSPLARGLLPRRGNTRPHCGIIPARAGFTLHRPERPVCHRDHPRSRGVYAAVRIGDDPAPGSSPLARGLPDDSPDGGVSGGIIPARAGFTHFR